MIVDHYGPHIPIAYVVIALMAGPVMAGIALALLEATGLITIHERPTDSPIVDPPKFQEPAS